VIASDTGGPSTVEHIGVLKEAIVKRDLRGFASMDGTKQRRIASMGGRAAHAKGTAHEWSSEQARVAGRKGGLARARLYNGATKKTPD